jgi:predicted glycoside hydrolase/deacetylase ChbG (UPF0249 family)
MTRGALEAAQRGVVTAVSVTAVGEDVEGAAVALREMPLLDVGAHLVLVGERPLSPPRDVPSLLGRDGALLAGAGAFCARYARGGIRVAEVRLELGRQLDRLLARGLRLTHLDSHQHLHALPRLFEVVASLAEECDVPFVRLPLDPTLPAPLSPRLAGLRVLRAFARRCRGRAPRGVATLDGALALADAGRLTPERLAAVLRERWSGRLELVCHPGRGDAALAGRYPWGYAWDAEREALCDPALPSLLAAEGIELTSFTRLAAAA